MFWSAVECLFARCRPTTVVERIRTVVIDAIQRLSKWRISHIGVEVFKDHPTFTNGNSTPAVVFERDGFWIEASRLHRFPAAVGACIGLSSLRISTLAMLESMFCRALDTSARLRTSSKVVAKGDAFVSTIASTQPTGVLRMAIKERKDSQTAKFLACKIDGAHKLDYRLRSA